MKIGYRYLDVVWSSISDCEEIALSIYQEKVYIYGLRRIMEGHADWRERVDRYEKQLKNVARHKWEEIKIMD